MLGLHKVILKERARYLTAAWLFVDSTIGKKVDMAEYVEGSTPSRVGVDDVNLIGVWRIQFAYFRLSCAVWKIPARSGRIQT